jgi:hypothetical protein
LWADWFARTLPMRPMPSFRIVTQILWGIPLVLQTAIVFAMLIRKQIKMFPFFFSYTAIVLIADFALLFLNYRSNIYGFIYWSTEALAALLSFGAIF